MNTQTKKILTITAVVVFHLGVITVMVAQPGCKSDSEKSAVAEPPASANTTTPAEAVASTPPTLSPPTRPTPEPPPYVAPAYTPPSTPPVVVTRMESPGETIPPATIPTTSVSAPPPTITYVVKSTDRGLSPIARANGVTLKELLAANPGMTETTLIHAGDKINIVHSAAATATTPAATADEASLYTVVDKDNLTVIARKLHTTIAALRTANNLKSDIVQPGQKLTIPAAGSAAPATTSNPTSTVPADANAAGEYTMVANDTPSSVAKKFGVSLADLMKVNDNMTEAQARALRPGKVLKLPSNAKPASGTSTPPPTAPVSGPRPLSAPPASIPSSTTSSTPTTITPATVDAIPVAPVN